LRIVSFLPSATEILYALGCGEKLVGVTHECDYPRAAQRKPRMIEPSFDSGAMTSKAIDQKIVELARSGKEIFLVNEKLMKKANPDLIIAQGICDVCSPYTTEVNKALDLFETKPDVLVLNPTSVSGILESIMQVARKVGRESEGERLVVSLRTRIQFIKAITHEEKRRVLCLEWLDPPFTAGHWVPEMVEMAGGVHGLSSKGESSRRMGFEEAVEFDPDLIALMPCGFNVSRTILESRLLASRKEWNSLRAVRDGNIYVVDSNSYFSKPGPRTITGLEILAKIVSPSKTQNIKVPGDSYTRLAIVSVKPRYTHRPGS